MNCYKTAVKVHVPHILCTRVRATVVFQKQFLEKRLWLEHVCKVLRFLNTILISAGVLQCFLKVLQNRSESGTNAFLKVEKVKLKGNYNGFRSAHKKNAVKTDCFGAEHAEGPNTLQKQWFERPEAPTPQWEADFEPNQLQMRASWGGTP